MIGTLICRNCDTVFEVSEGDVTKFKVHPVFNCTVCNSDLSQMMASLVTGHSAKPDNADEFTIPDDAEVFADLPMGETFDQAAAKMRGTGTAQPRPAGSPLGDTVRSAEPPLAARPRPVTDGSMAVAEPALAPTPAEDPVQMALRMAKEAQAAMEAQSMVPGSDPPASEIGETTGIAIRWKPATPSAITAPVAVPVNGGRSTEAGVVPEEPDNEPTARGKGASEPTGTEEPTKPSDPVNNEPARDEMTPLLGSSQFRFPAEDSVVETADDEAIPDVPDDVAAVPPGGPEPTPAVPPHLSDPPIEEVTIRKASAPPPLPLQGLGVKPLLVRSGNGPASVGALGIRVMVGRPVVRPANGRAPSTSGDTAISAGPSPASSNSGRYESVRTPSAGTRVPAATAPSASLPPPVAAAPAPPAESVSFDAPAPQRRLAITPPMIAAGAGAVVLVAALTIWAVRHHNQGPVATETPVATAVAEASPAETVLVVATPEVATPVKPHFTPTVRATPATTATTAVLSTATPRPSRTAVAVSSTAPATPHPTTPTATPTARPESSQTLEEAKAKAAKTQQALDDAKSKAATGDLKAATKSLYIARFTDPSSEPLTYWAWKYASEAKGDTAVTEATKFATEYINGFNGKFVPDATRKKEVVQWRALHPVPPSP